MAFIFLILLITAAILFFSNRKDEATRWAVFFLLCGSGGSLGITIEYSILPALHTYKISNSILDHILFYIQIYSSYLNQICFPYAILMYSIVYSELIGRKLKNRLAYVLLLPVLFTYAITPIDEKIKIDYKIILIWVAPYLLFSCFLLVYSYFKETIKSKKHNRFRTIVIILPTVIGILVLNYLSKALALGIPLYRYLALLVGFSFFMFIVFSFINGALGVKLKFERQRLDSTMRAMTSGTSILNHTIKNEIGKISILADRIKTIAVTNEQNDIDKYIDTIIGSTEHMLAMVARIQSQLQDIVLQTHSHRIEEIVDASLAMVRPYLEKQNIRVIKDVNCHAELLCDKVHLQEVFSNLFMNAIEAMNADGQLYVSLYETSKDIVVEIKDNGIGISKEDLPRIMDPFFSTKNRNQNFGLGLSYCYNVMQKHGGSLDIDSEKNVGTTMTLYFSKKRSVVQTSMPRFEEVTYGQD